MKLRSIKNTFHSKNFWINQKNFKLKRRGRSLSVVIHLWLDFKWSHPLCLIVYSAHHTASWNDLSCFGWFLKFSFLTSSGVVCTSLAKLDSFLMLSEYSVLQSIWDISSERYSGLKCLYSRVLPRITRCIYPVLTTQLSSRSQLVILIEKLF